MNREMRCTAITVCNASDGATVYALIMAYHLPATFGPRSSTNGYLFSELSFPLIISHATLSISCSPLYITIYIIADILIKKN